MFCAHSRLLLRGCKTKVTPVTIEYRNNIIKQNKTARTSWICLFISEKVAWLSTKGKKNMVLKRQKITMKATNVPPLGVFCYSFQSSIQVHFKPSPRGVQNNLTWALWTFFTFQRHFYTNGSCDNQLLSNV